MNQYNEISTLQYMGSKVRIISHICDPISKRIFVPHIQNDEVIRRIGA